MNSNEPTFYCIGKKPNSLFDHNLETWELLESSIEASGGKASYGYLCDLASGHKHFGREDGNPERFIDYCIRNGWLKRCRC